jgi:hypothetical protein
MNAPALTTEELARLEAAHTGVTLPDAHNVGSTVTLCLACGGRMPCPVRRLVTEVRKLREIDATYSASLHER